jgi:hypothetical protein
VPSRSGRLEQLGERGLVVPGEVVRAVVDEDDPARRSSSTSTNVAAISGQPSASAASRVPLPASTNIVDCCTTTGRYWPLRRRLARMVAMSCFFALPG